MKVLLVQQLMLWITKPSLCQHLSLDEWSSLLLVLRKSKMLARLSAWLSDHALLQTLPIEVQRHLQNAADLAERQQQQTRQEAKALVSQLSNMTSTLVFLKGAGYSLSANAAHVGRVYSDIDVLVPKQDIAAVESCLAIFGWYRQPLSDYDERYYREWAHEIPPIAHGGRGTVLDLHHNLVPLVSGKSLQMDTFLKGYVQDNEGIKTLSTAAQFYHSAIHLFFNEDFSSAFRDLNDLYLMYVEHQSVIDRDLMTLVTEFGFAREMALAFYFIDYFYQLPIQPALRQALHQHYAVSRLDRFIFSRVLLPDHPLVALPFRRLAMSLAEIRGHRLKMPLPVLGYHLTMKLYRSIAEQLLGKHIFTEKTPSTLKQGE